MALNRPIPSVPVPPGELVNILATTIPIIEVLHSHGVPYRTWLAKAGLPTEIEDPLQRVETRRILRFTHQAAYSQGIPELGMLAALRGPERVLHPRILGRIDTSPTLLTALKAVRELVYAQASSLQIWLALRRRQLWVCHCTLNPVEQPGSDFFEILRTVRLIGVIERFLGRGWRPARVDLVMPQVRDPLFRSWLGDAEIRTGAACGMIPVPIERLGDAVADAGGGIGSDSRSDSEVPGWELRLGALEAAVMSDLARGTPTIGDAAEMVGVSARTLQRRFSESGTTYREFLTNLRFQEARRLLLDTDMPIREVTARVGYTDVSNFARAFRRVAGISPADLRHQA
jgi:AraC-like DNA-binding protein